jgi:hypothetical protein
VGNTHPAVASTRSRARPQAWDDLRTVRGPRLDEGVIVIAHVATGAVAGRVLGSRVGALASGPLLHLVGDRIPHTDIPSRPFEIGTGSLGVVALAGRLGPIHPATLGAVAACLPDVEHLFPFPRPGGRKLFPSHRFHGWHRAGGLPAWLQLVGAGVILGAILAARPKP